MSRRRIIGEPNSENPQHETKLGNVRMAEQFWRVRFVRRRFSICESKLSMSYK